MTVDDRDTRPWIKLTIEYPRHRKIRGLSDKAFRLHVTLLALCAEEKNDGHILPADLNMYGPRAGKELRDVGLVDKTPDGWVLHDYTRHQTCAETVTKATTTKAKAGALGGKKSVHTRLHVGRGQYDPECPWCQTPPDLDSPGTPPI